MARDANGHILFPTWFLALVAAALFAAGSAVLTGGLNMYSDVRVIKSQVQDLAERTKRIEDTMLKK